MDKYDSVVAQAQPKIQSSATAHPLAGTGQFQDALVIPIHQRY